MALAGIYYRQDKGLLTGRNGESTAAAIRSHYAVARDMIAADARTDDAPLCEYLDNHPRLAAKWDALERRVVGLRP